MGATKIILVRHAEKPGKYFNNPKRYAGFTLLGKPDVNSLISLGWQRAGALANLLCPTNEHFSNKQLCHPNYIFAANPNKNAPPNNHKPASKRPFQTIQPLADKLGYKSKHINANHPKENYDKMVAQALTCKGTVLISWQHQLILPDKKKWTKNQDSIVMSLLKQTNTNPNLVFTHYPKTSAKSNIKWFWPTNRFDMLLVLNRPSGKGPFTSFYQVPQMLLEHDSTKLFPL